MSIHAQINSAGRKLCEDLTPLRFELPVTHVYNPLEYARSAHEAYVRRYGTAKKRVLFLGMNPGPYGMAQTGVPFGEVQLVRDWLGIEERVDKPQHEHPKRPVLGFSCPRSEVSGKRLWSAIAEHFGTPDNFFREFFVANYCPLIFMEESGRNRTPDKLPAHEKKYVFSICDRYLQEVVKIFEPEWVIGIGSFAERRARNVCREILKTDLIRVASILHPSPANPMANKDWSGTVFRQMCKLGVCQKV